MIGSASGSTVKGLTSVALLEFVLMKFAIVTDDWLTKLPPKCEGVLDLNLTSF
jgi:hypothetical protein